MATLRNERKIAAVSRETPQITRNSQSQNTLYQGMAQQYISQVSEKIASRVTKKFFKEFSQTESRILGDLFKLNEFLLNPQVRTCSVAAPGASKNKNSENRGPTGKRSLSKFSRKTVFFACHSSNLKDLEQEQTHYKYHLIYDQKIGN